MSRSSIPADLRAEVSARDRGYCTWCRLAQLGHGATFHVDHIRPRSRGGTTTIDNLALQSPRSDSDERRDAPGATMDDVTVRTPLPINDEVLADFCLRHQVCKLSLFGSTLKGTARPDSDIDLLVEFSPTARPTLFTLAAMEDELTELMGGRKIDLRTPAELSRYFRDAVVREAEVRYVAG